MQAAEQTTTQETPNAPAHDLGQVGGKPQPKKEKRTMSKKTVSHAKLPPKVISEIHLIELDRIEVKENVRTVFDDEGLQELARDIEARGLLQPAKDHKEQREGTGEAFIEWACWELDELLCSEDAEDDAIKFLNGLSEVQRQALQRHLDAIIAAHKEPAKGFDWWKNELRPWRSNSTADQHRPHQRTHRAHREASRVGLSYPLFLWTRPGIPGLFVCPSAA